MRNLFTKNLNGRIVFILFILTQTVYVIMLTVTVPMVMAHSQGMKIPDLMPFGYDLEYLNKLFTTLGVEGRHDYLFKQLPMDMIYPFLFAFTFSMLAAYILKKMGKLSGPIFYFCLLPFFSGFFDYCENIGLITLLNTFPELSPRLVVLTNLFSILKSMTTTVFMVYLCILILVFVYHRLSKKAISHNTGA